MFCFHKYNPPIDRQQTCSKCGLVRIIPCSHKWEIFQTIPVTWHTTGAIAYTIYIQKCKHCGEMLKLLETGNLKERTIESCLDCKSKKGSDYLNCDKIKGQLLAMSGKLNTEKSTVSGKTSIWVMKEV